MSAKFTKLFLASGVLITLAEPAWAQQTVNDQLLGVINAPQFFVAIIAGILLAFGFQSVLTALSVAVGLSATPDLAELSAKHHARAMARKDGFIDDDEEKIKKDGSLAVKVTTTFGFWALITTSIALFFATWLAVKLSFVSVTEIGLVLGLVIWAAFFVIMTYLELRTVRSAMGGIVSLAFSSFRGTFDAVRSVFTPSLNKQIEDASRKSVRAIYDEINQIAHHDHLDRRLHDYLMDLKPAVPDYNRIRDDVRELIDHIQIEEKINVEEEDVVRVLSLHLEKNGKIINKQNATKLMDTARQATREAKRQSQPVDKAMAAAQAVLPMKQEELQHYLQRITDYLNESGAEELNPQELRHDIEEIFAHPGASAEIIRHRLSSIDENTIRKLLINHPKVSEEQADKYTGMLMQALEYVKGKHATNGNGLNKPVEGRSSKKKLPQKVEEKLHSYFDSLDHPELNYEVLKNDFTEILHDPAAAPRVLRERLAHLDKDAVVALLSSNSHISQRQAETIANKAMEARDVVNDKIHWVEDEALRRYNQMSRRTILAAEHARESAVAASWWTVGTAMVSGIAAAVGGLLGTSI